MYNLGTGQGYSVLQLVKAFEKATGKPVSRVKFVQSYRYVHFLLFQLKLSDHS